MNLLIYELAEFCKSMSIVDIAKHCWVNRYRQRRCKWEREDTELLNEWLEIKIKKLIKFKKTAEKLLDEYK